MFYFFERQDQFIRCEMRLGDAGYELVVLRPDGTERREQFETEEELQKGWEALQREFVRDGWWGPHTRD